MPYNALSTDEVKRIDGDYKALKLQQTQTTDRTAKANLGVQMEQLGVAAEEELNKNIHVVQGYLATHSQNVDKAVTDALAELKTAKTLAASFKKDSKQAQHVNDIKASIQKIITIETDFKQDAKDFGEAWKAFRASAFAPNIPQKYQTSFQAARAKIINDDKVKALKLNQVTGAQHEAEALLAIVNKAAEKRTMKDDKAAGFIVAQRDIALAQADAKAVAVQLDGLLKLLRAPQGLAPKPDSITSAKTALVNFNNEAGYLNKPNALAGVRGQWSTADAAYKLMTAKAKTMDTVLTTKTKGFHTSELKDATVKGELAKAAKSVKDAKADVTAKAKDYAAAKKAYDALLVKAKKLGVK